MLASFPPSPTPTQNVTLPMTVQWFKQTQKQKPTLGPGPEDLLAYRDYTILQKGKLFPGQTPTSLYF